MRFNIILPLFFMLYANQTEASSPEILDPETPQAFASKALGQILTTLNERLDIDKSNLTNIKLLSQQRSAQEKTTRLFEYLEIAELKDLGEHLLTMSFALFAIHQANYESALTHDLIGQTADLCCGMIEEKIREYSVLVVKLRKTQQKPSQEAIETLIKEMFVSHLKECKTTPYNARPPYFSIAWDRVFAMVPPRESHLLFDLAVTKEIMDNHVMCSSEHNIIGIKPSTFIYFYNSIITTSERSQTIITKSSIASLTQERQGIFDRYCEAVVKLSSDQACLFLLNCGSILRGLQETCQDINRRIEECYIPTA